MSQSGTFSSGVIPPGTAVVTLTGNTGGAVSPDGAGNIDVVGDTTTITIAGNPGTNTLTASTTGAVAIQFDEDTGSAIPALGVLHITGGSNIATVGAGSTVTIDLDGTTNHAVQVGNAGGSLTSLGVGTNGQVLLGSTGADPSFVTPTAGNGLSVTANATTLSYALTAPVSIANGGTNATSMTTTDGVVYYDGTRLVTTAVGTATHVLTSNGVGVAPTFQAVAAGTVTNLTADSGGALSPTAGNFNIFGGLNIVTSGSGSTITIAEKQAVLANNYSVANATPYVVAATDYYITVDTSTTAITIQLPDAPTNYQIFIIKDSAGNAVNRNITVTTVSGIKLIDGATTFVMNTNYQSAHFLYDAFGYQAF